MGARGYPNIFAVGEVANDRLLVDRQHPHDLFMELSARVDYRLGGGDGLVLEGGPVAEPALGPSAFVHRASAFGGREADERRWTVDRPKLDSRSVRANWEIDARHAVFGRLERIRADELFPDEEDPSTTGCSTSPSWRRAMRAV